VEVNTDRQYVNPVKTPNRAMPTKKKGEHWQKKNGSKKCAHQGTIKICKAKKNFLKKKQPNPENSKGGKKQTGGGGPQKNRPKTKEKQKKGEKRHRPRKEKKRGKVHQKQNLAG